MRHFNRGTQIDFSVVFHDANEAVAVPDAATLTIAHPPSGGGYPLDGSEPTEVRMALTRNLATEAWEASWDSSVSGAGIVFWAAVSSDPALTVEEGRFRLKGNRATLKATG